MKLRFLDSLRAKVTIGVLLVSLTPLVVAGLFAIGTANRVVESIVTNQLENLAAEKQALLERWIGERKADVEVIAGSAIAGTLDARQLAPYLKLVQAKYEVYRRFVVAGVDGRTVYDTGAGPAAVDCAKETWFQRAKAGQRYMSEVRLAGEGHDSIFLLAAPIADDAGRAQGVLCATVNTAAILGRVLRLSLGETGECYLVDRQGTFLVHKDPRRILRDNIAGSGSFDKIFRHDAGDRVYTDYRQIAVLGATRSISGTDWFLVVEQDEDEAFAGAWKLRTTMALVSVVTAVGAIGLSMGLAYYVTAPTRSLSQAARHLAAAEFDAAIRSLPGPRADEIGTLREAFHDMASHLRQRYVQFESRIGATQAQLEMAEFRLKNTLDAAERAEHLALVGRLASGVAHEIRTPLTSLKLYLQSIQEEFGLPPTHAEDLAVAMQQIDRMGKTINHFLQFARPQDPVMVRLEVQKLLDDALLIVRPRANHQHVALTVQIDGPLPAVVGDVRQLGEAVTNLMVNALEEMPSGGQLTLTAGLAAEPPTADATAWVCIEVTDTGPGIPAEDIERVFEPFYSTKAAGAGLGLSIVRATAQRHGGTVRVRTQAGASTTFSILLPVAGTAPK